MNVGGIKNWLLSAFVLIDINKIAKYEVNSRKGYALRPNWTVYIEIIDKVLYGNHQLQVNRNPLK